jgi:hypothetical protein
MISLFDYQKKAVSELKPGSILWGSVGSGKSLTALAYFYIVECGGAMEPEFKEMKTPKDLYVITTPRKRDELDWDGEAANFGISKESSTQGIRFTVDSWNNIAKYDKVQNAFFIFDEQKVVGYGAWVKAFLKIAKSNKWILLTATPGDTWSDYLPIFIANGFFKNKTEFTRDHVVYNTYTSYPKIDRYVNEGKLQRLKRQILVKMDYKKKTIDHIITVLVSYNEKKFDKIFKDRWNPFKNKPIENGSEYYYSMRKVVNSDPSRLDAIVELWKKHKKLIVFYNFDYELDMLRRLNDILAVQIAEYNGHLHEPIPQGDSWIYLAQYISAGEAWNCIETNAIVLYSRNYSYKQTIQAMGRIDRQNTPFLNLYYYFLSSDSWIDQAVAKAYKLKKNFNEPKI